jgi:hypothetical protein
MAARKSWYVDYVYQAENPFAGVPPEVIELIRAELAEGEEILWFEQPSAGSLWRTELFGVWLLFPTYAFLDFILPILTVGAKYINWMNLILTYSVLIFFVIGGYFFLSHEAKKSLYVLTNQRAIRVNASAKGVYTSKVRSYYLNQHIHPALLKVKWRRSDRGDLVFAKELRGATHKNMVFRGIHQVDQVKALFEKSLALKSENPVATLPLKLQPAINAGLTTGEKVLWAAQPDPHWLLKAQEQDAGKPSYLTIVACIIGVLLLAYVFVFLSIFSSISFQFLLVPLGFIFLVMLLVPFLTFRRLKQTRKTCEQAEETAYLLTNQRVLWVTALPQQEEKLESYYFVQQPQKERLTVVKHRDKTGDLYLSVVDEGNHFKPKVKLIGIWEPDKVERLIRQQLASY